MPAANDLRRGMAIKYNGNPAIVLEVHHRTPGNLRAFVQAIIRYINTGKSADVRFGSTDKVELVDIERKPLEFSYHDRNGYHFMDPETYDTLLRQLPLATTRFIAISKSGGTGETLMQTIAALAAGAVIANAASESAPASAVSPIRMVSSRDVFYIL